MAITRRSFVQTAAIGAGAALTSSVWGRGRENSVWSAFDANLEAVEKGMICIGSNENPVGPGKKVLDGLRALLEGGAKPGRYSNQVGELTESIAAHFKVKTENVLLSEGSTEILRAATQVFTAKTKPLVGTIPTYEECTQVAELIGNPVRGVKLNSEFKIDLDAMLAASKGAGLIFYCNPNNPTATYVGAKATRDFIQKLNAASPETTILIDEAYFDYVTDPDHQTHAPIAIENPRVIVARTFSKAYGMAGVRIGYAIGDLATIKKMSAYRMPYNVNTFGVAAAVASLKDPQHIKDESARNKAVRDFTVKALADLGYTSTDSQTNFIFTDIGKTMTAAAFRDACAAKGVMVGRDFPPMEKQWARISLGTMEEMQKATEVFRSVLKSSTTTSSGKE
jgi:histidinol-phosphate aminotransferase